MNKQYMILKKIYRRNSFIRKQCLHAKFSDPDNLKILCKYLQINKNRAQYLQLKYPGVRRLNAEKIEHLVGTMYDLGYSREVLVDEPSLCSYLPITLKYRYAVLQECGLSNILIQHLTSYLQIIKQRKVKDLKSTGIIPMNLNIENRLASYMTQWPTSLTTLVYGDVSEFTLYTLRIKIIQRYLELMLDLSPEEFARGLQTYPTIKHRPLQTINNTLNLLKNEILMPHDKLKSNLYLVHADPDNLKNIVYNFKSIGGVNIKDIIRMHPKLAMVNCSTMMETKRVLKEFGVSKEAQTKCFDIYTLSPITIKERLQVAKSIPEFNSFFNHPRFLKMIHFKNTALKRLLMLYNNDKKCLSLNILSGSTAHYETFEKTPGDRFGKGKDIVFSIRELLENNYSSSQIRNNIKRHPFWVNIPLVQIRYVYEQLRSKFSIKDIYENCFILLYPWNKIRDISCSFDKKQNTSQLHILDQVDLTELSSSQKLSLILYLLERSHYFSGNGVWSEEKHKNIDNNISKTESRQV